MYYTACVWYQESILKAGLCFRPVPTFSSPLDAQGGKHVQVKYAFFCVLHSEIVSTVVIKYCKQSVYDNVDVEGNFTGDMFAPIYHADRRKAPITI